MVKLEAAAQRARVQALRDNSGVLADMEQAFTDVDVALHRLRADRVVEMVAGHEPRMQVVAIVGEPPASLAGGQAWCALAYEIETYRDHHPEALGREHEKGVQAAIGPSPSSLSDRTTWDHLARRIADGAEIIAVAGALPFENQPGRLGGPERWSERLNHAFEARDAVVALEREAPGPGSSSDGLPLRAAPQRNSTTERLHVHHFAGYRAGCRVSLHPAVGRSGHGALSFGQQLLSMRQIR